MSRWAPQAWRATGACGFLAALAFSAWAEAQPAPSTPPVAPAELGDGPIDEVAQLERIRAALKDHYRLKNKDTRFIIDRNDKGIFHMMRNVGLVHFPADDNPKKTMIGTGTLLSDCFVLTAYHVLEGSAVIDGNLMPLLGRRVMFSYGPKPGRVDGFSFRSFGAVAHDPEILNLSERRWSDDMVLIRAEQKISNTSMSTIMLGHIFDRTLPTQSWLDENEFFLAIGFPGDVIEKSKLYRAFGDFCSIKGASRNAGLVTNCEITKGMSGGPLLYFERNGDGRLRQTLVGIGMQSSSGDGIAAKSSGAETLFSPLTPTKIAKIKAIIDRPTDDNCMPTDGKPW